MPSKILVVDDEPDILELVETRLAMAGYETITAESGEEALKSFFTARPDLALLDLEMPGMDGFELCERIRQISDVPIIFLTVFGSEVHRVKGLQVGADDYIVKPFALSLLLARMRAVLRRTRPALSEDKLQRGDLIVDLSAHRVIRAGTEVHLGPTEYRLLRHLMEHPARVFSREQLLDAVWGRDSYVDPRTVDVHVRRLRKALNTEGHPDAIRTVRAAGYALGL